MRRAWGACHTQTGNGRSLFLAFAGQQSGFSTQGWFIGTMCAVALLTLIALMACFLRRNKGGKYAGTPPLQRQDMFSMDKGQLVFQQGRVPRVASLQEVNQNESPEMYITLSLIVVCDSGWPPERTHRWPPPWTPSCIMHACRTPMDSTPSSLTTLTVNK